MLSLLKRSIAMTFRRLGQRSITSALLEDYNNIEDFQVENEPVLAYLKGSQERAQLEAALEKYGSQCEDIPIIIGGEEVRTEDVHYQVIPFDHQKKIAKFYYATPEIIEKGIQKALAVRPEWERVPISEKIKIFLKAADLMATTYRMDLNATTMLGQSKTVVQAEIDAACELIDFLRYNAFFAKEILQYQPLSCDKSVTHNFLRYRGIEGFVASISPFNFTAIGGNLAFTPTLMGNVVLWKPSDTSLLANYITFKVMMEAGIPPGVVNFIPADGPVFGDTIIKSPDLAGISFTGSVPTFRRLWSQVGQNISNYKNFPRMSGECGGKNYHFVHKSADVDSVVKGTIKSAFEYCGQKCSACSRLYVPESLWPEVKEGLLELQQQLKVGPATDYESYYSAVIDQKAFDRIKGYIDHVQSSPNLKVLAGGKCDDSKGYFVQPTIVETTTPEDRIMKEEIFGPVLTCYVYKDSETNQVLESVGKTTPYALTGAVFAEDGDFLQKATEVLKMSAGNFYINDKSTGSVVGQQPFGGGRISGTNDKPGGLHYILKWASAQAIKENYVPVNEWKYPYMEK